jgi:hypothetical protein
MNEEEEKSKILYDGDIKGRIKIKVNDFTFLFCRPDREEKAKKKYAKYFKKKFIKY